MEEIISKLEQALEEIRGRLVEAAGGQSVCSIHKYDTPTMSLKFNEGKEYAVRSVLNRLRKNPSQDEIDGFLEETENRFKQIETSGLVSSPGWQAYAAGGLGGIGLVKDLLMVNGNQSESN